MAQFQYKGKGFLQGTGRSNMALNSPITISGTNLATSLKNINTVSMSSHAPWDLTFGGDNTHTNLKKFEMYESTEDVLSLAVAAHRVMATSQIFYKITDRELYNKVEQQDRDKAKEVRDYYSKKVMMLKLKGNGQMSKFREDMNKLIHSDGLIFKEDMIGIAYWLPKFYEYDTELDDVKSHVITTQNFESMNQQGSPITRNLSATLSPIKCLKRMSKRTKAFEYWMKDDKLNSGVVLNLEEKNQLQHLWDHIFTTESSIKIKGNYTRRTRDGFEYFSITNWSLDRS